MNDKEMNGTGTEPIVNRYLNLDNDGKLTTPMPWEQFVDDDKPIKSFTEFVRTAGIEPYPIQRIIAKEFFGEQLSSKTISECLHVDYVPDTITDKLTGIKYETDECKIVGHMYLNHYLNITNLDPTNQTYIITGRQAGGTYLAAMILAYNLYKYPDEGIGYIAATKQHCKEVFNIIKNLMISNLRVINPNNLNIIDGGYGGTLLFSMNKSNTLNMGLCIVDNPRKYNSIKELKIPNKEPNGYDKIKKIWIQSDVNPNTSNYKELHEIYHDRQSNSKFYRLPSQFAKIGVVDNTDYETLRRTLTWQQYACDIDADLDLGYKKTLKEQLGLDKNGYANEVILQFNDEPVCWGVVNKPVQQVKETKKVSSKLNPYNEKIIVNIMYNDKVDTFELGKEDISRVPIYTEGIDNPTGYADLITIIKNDNKVVS